MSKCLLNAAKQVFNKYHLAPIRPTTDAASKFISVERLDRMTGELDPLSWCRAWAALKWMSANLFWPRFYGYLRLRRPNPVRADSRLMLQDLFSAAPYGWTKDTVRYIFAALLRAGEVEFHKPGMDGVIRTAGTQAADAVKSTVEFNRIGVSIRDTKPSNEALDRAARRLEKLFGIEVLPLKSESAGPSGSMPDLIEKVGALPDRLRLLELPGEERAGV